MNTETEKEDSVPIPEEFQVKVKALLEGANKHQLDFVRSCCSECEHMEEFTDKEMPE